VDESRAAQRTGEAESRTGTQQDAEPLVRDICPCGPLTRSSIAQTQAKSQLSLVPSGHKYHASAESHPHACAHAGSIPYPAPTSTTEGAPSNTKAYYGAGAPEGEEPFHAKEEQCKAEGSGEGGELFRLGRLKRRRSSDEVDGA